MNSTGTTTPSSWVKRYFAFLLKHQKTINGAVIVATVVSLFFASKLALKTSFSELLPEKLHSVHALLGASERLGGTGTLVIGVESPSFEANKKFVEALAPKLQPLVGKKLRYMEYRYTDVRAFAQKYALHYLTLEQLEKLSSNLSTEIEKQKDKAVGGFLGLGDDDEKSAAEKKSTAEDSDPLASVDPTLAKFMTYKDAYLSANKGKILAISLRPLGSSLDVGQSKELMSEVKKAIDEVGTKTFHPKMRVEFVGNVSQAVEEFETIKSDILDTALMLTGLILGILFVYFWSIKVILFLLSNLILAVIWTFCVTDLAIGYLNTQTAFLGSLVVGTGINYGIIFISRYLELRRSGKSLEDSILGAVEGTLLPTFIASSTTAVSFVSLFYASNKGFSQFGFIGGIGVLFCWATAFSLLPIWFYAYEKAFPNSKLPVNPLARRLAHVGHGIGNSIVRHSSIYLGFLVIITLASIPGVIKLFADPLERNFDNLRNKSMVSKDTLDYRDRVGQVFATSWTPSLVLVDNEAEARQICPSVKARKDSIDPKENVIASCLGLYDLVPKPNPEANRQKKLFSEIRTKFGNRLLKFTDHADMIEQLRTKMSDSPPLESELPQQITQRYTELNGKVGLFAIVNPDDAKPLNDARNLLAFTKGLTDVPLLGTTKTFTAAGDSFVLADLLRNIEDEGPKVALIAFIGTVLIAMFLSGGLRAGLLMALCLSLATLWMMGLQGYWGLKYNFFNFIALPLTFGIGVDYPINVYLRSKQEGFKHYSKVFVGSGMAVVLCSLTTFIGYYVLLGASSLALASFGRIAIIGEFTCLFSALVVVPVGLKLAGGFQDSNVKHTHVADEASARS